MTQAVAGMVWLTICGLSVLVWWPVAVVIFDYWSTI